MELEAMGRPKKKERSEPSPSFSMKGDPEWVEWVDEFADFLKVTKASLVDRALVELARFVGFKRPAPPRFKAK
jgi:hypothetical protein